MAAELDETNIGFTEEIGIIEIKVSTLSGALDYTIIVPDVMPSSSASHSDPGQLFYKKLRMYEIVIKGEWTKYCSYEK